MRTYGILTIIMLMIFYAKYAISTSQKQDVGKIIKKLKEINSPIVSDLTTRSIDNTFEITETEKQIGREIGNSLSSHYGRNMRIVCVCTGNTCRSASAQAMLMTIYGGSIDVSSLGVNARVIGNPETRSVREIRLGTPWPNPELEMVSNRHQSRDITHPNAEQELTEADFIFAMDSSHKSAILKRFPHIESSKIIVLNVKDPFRDAHTISRTPVSSTYGLNYEMVLNLERKLMEVMMAIVNKELSPNVLQNIYHKFFGRFNLGTGKRRKKRNRNRTYKNK